MYVNDTPEMLGKLFCIFCNRLGYGNSGQGGQRGSGPESRRAAPWGRASNSDTWWTWWELQQVAHCLPSLEGAGGGLKREVLFFSLSGMDVFSNTRMTDP